jgi:hypothetical protein
MKPVATQPKVGGLTVDQLKKRRQDLINEQQNSGDLGTEETQTKIDDIDKQIKNVQSGKVWVNAYTRAGKQVNGYWRTAYGLGLPKTAGQGTTR